MNSNWMPGVAALMGLALAGPATAAPRVIYETGDRYANTQYSAYSGQVGYENGYGDGLKRGRHDGDRGDRFDVTKDSKYRDGDHGYKSSYGARSQYVRAYRSGYEQGYRDGFAPYTYAGRARSGGYYGTDGYGRGTSSRDGYGRAGGYYDRDGYWHPY
jgi:hypothetical protein